MVNPQSRESSFNIIFLITPLAILRGPLVVHSSNSFLRPNKISMILAAKHRKKSHFDSLALLVRSKIFSGAVFMNLERIRMNKLENSQYNRDSN
ncbi:hypothetical protein BpHYR1_045807 [Brachionus plicatilis]|uniref:Uncharacterized protein n=1 Tax=Brachionus plicatilis TaxID=10195 RepID=A0A3M7SZB0_BRAPC|nr:hypothetical protein BpHYR1_045807 [Brachionus plicatilis]